MQINTASFHPFSCDPKHSSPMFIAIHQSINHYNLLLVLLACLLKDIEMILHFYSNACLLRDEDLDDAISSLPECKTPVPNGFETEEREKNDSS
jgi:hypothetical protein